MITLLMGLTIVVLVMFLLGWLDVAKSEKEAAVRIQTAKIRQDVSSTVARARGLVR